MIHRYKLVIEYDGTPFSGWQRQASVPSIQQTLEDVIERFAGHPVRVTCAGRTDAGVHAVHQVAHVDLQKVLRTDTVRDATNAHMRSADAPISVLSCVSVPSTFDARLSARRRSYLYRILNRRSPGVLDAKRVWHRPGPLDAAAMAEGAQRLVGHYDFTAFRASDCQAKSPFRTLERLDVNVLVEEIRIHAVSRSFLHHQVRSMVGTLALVGAGRWTPDDVTHILESRDRTLCGGMAPAHGLYLVGVDYADEAMAF